MFTANTEMFPAGEARQMQIKNLNLKKSHIFAGTPRACWPVRLSKE